DAIAFKEPVGGAADFGRNASGIYPDIRRQRLNRHRRPAQAVGAALDASAHSMRASAQVTAPVRSPDRKFFAPCVGCLTKGDPMPCQDRAAPGGSRVT